MTGKKQVFSFIIISIAVLALTAVYIFLKSPPEDRKAEKTSSESLQKTPVKQGNADEQRREEKMRKLSAMKRAMKRAMRGGTETLHSISQEGDVDNMQPLSDEEIERRVELQQKTADVYFEMAPEILGEMLQSEMMDKSWKYDVEQQLPNVVEDARLAGSQITDVDCRETLCKVVVTLPSKEEILKFKDIWVTAGPKTGHNFGHHTDLPDGKVQTEIFFSRENTSEPFVKARESMVARMGMESSETM